MKLFFKVLLIFFLLSNFHILAADIIENKINTADLSISSIGETYVTHVGHTQTVTLRAHNNGPDTAENVEVSISIGNCFTNVTITANNGTYSNGIWTIGNLNNGEMVTLTMTNQMESFCNCSFTIFTHISSSTYDPSLSFNYHDVNYNWDTDSDLDLQSLPYSEPLSIGSTIFLNYELKNLGIHETCAYTNFATNGLTISSATTSDGIWDNSTKSWNSVLAMRNQTYTIQLECIINSLDNLSLSGYSQPNSFWEWTTDNNYSITNFTNLANNNFGISSEISVYPNPVKDILNIDINKNDVIENVKIYDLVGKKIMEQNNINQINLSNLNSGFYLAEIKTDSKTTRKKIIKE